MKIKTSELIGHALNFAAAVCEGYDEWEWDKDASNLWLVNRSTQTEHWLKCSYEPSTDWSAGGPIIDRERIGVEPHWALGCWSASWREERAATAIVRYGPTALVAAMRCFVASRLGDEVDVPEELLP